MEAESLSAAVAKMEVLANSRSVEVGEIRATLIANFGPGGGEEAGVVNDRMGTLPMLMTVLNHLVAKRKDGQ